MSQHLSPTQISRWIAGDKSSDDERHLQQCTECRLELARLESGLALFGQSVREWAQQQGARSSPEVSEHRNGGVPSTPWAWFLAAAAVAFAVAISIGPESRDARDEVRRQPDAQLLDQVHDQLMQTVPASLQPLMTLMDEERKERQ